ncbi:bifunctional diaminohydroxyphosphoribosylaminopyrimidine deaminase/5-amino-6-(5-phosphoribosylamino)uracil reductase RibD, partial [Alphaproteobacteria bacterium]|nr:bifunctional diaminohydroxyphosphoribosylaminopyrimidine deaminase/5-amino-6-(5-phosphoribosylamino)uracil reductase RibD [Alphaproteobacteria bacterium]
MDNFWLNAAFYQASYALGNTGKNPAVGCIIIKKNQIIGVGYTSKNGRPHAEENALSMAGRNANGSTLYVTLEPCCLDDNYNSCTNQIINAGIKKVVIGMLDYNKLTLRKSLNALKKNGIETKLVRIDFKNFLINYSHYCFNVLKRPMISIKLAKSADSKITYANGKSKWITSELSRKHVHQIRSNYDGILVGSNTFFKDNPSLTVRVDGYNKVITRIILDTNLIFNIKSKLLKKVKSNPIIVFTNRSLNSEKAKILSNKGIKIFHTKKLEDGNLCVTSIIKKLFELNL